jgi:hypothetical protein
MKTALHVVIRKYSRLRLYFLYDVLAVKEECNKLQITFTFPVCPPQLPSPASVSSVQIFCYSADCDSYADWDGCQVSYVVSLCLKSKYYYDLTWILLYRFSNRKQYIIWTIWKLIVCIYAVYHALAWSMWYDNADWLMNPILPKIVDE